MLKAALTHSPQWKCALAVQHKVPDAAITGAVKRFYEALDTPLSLSCWLQYQHGEFDDLVSREIDPGKYNSPSQFKSDFAAISFLKKSEFVKTSFDREGLALAKFAENENVCKRINYRFRHLSSDPEFRGPNVWLLHAVTRKIDKILGDFDVAEFFSQGSFGPGSSVTIKDDTSTVRKFREERSITSTLYQLVGQSLEAAYPLWYRDGALKNLEIHEFSKVITVPKNAKIDRTIAVEPGLNIWFQKAVGKMIRSRLCRSGVNLSGWKHSSIHKRKTHYTHVMNKWLEPSSDFNGRMAREGSQGLGLATVDFSSASDTISLELIREILPPRWFSVLDACRTRDYLIPGQTVKRFEKFSSMGNGFTFELESLIFYTAALACAEFVGRKTDKISVFGDDVIIPSSVYDCYSSFCNFLGFTVNAKKSFASGCFRESCGSYFFGGVDVKPLFLKKRPGNTFEVFNLANRVRMLSHSAGSFPHCDQRFERLHSFLCSLVPKKIRVLGTMEGGMGCIWSNFDQAVPSKLRDGLEGFSFRTFTFPAAMLESDHPSLISARLFSTSDQAYKNEYAVRSRVNTHYKRVSVQQWYDFGPWL